MFGILMVVLGVFLVGYLVVKKYYAPWALFLVGLILLTVVAFGMGAPVVKKSTGSVIFDIMKCSRTFPSPRLVVSASKSC